MLIGMSKANPLPLSEGLISTCFRINMCYAWWRPFCVQPCFLSRSSEGDMVETNHELPKKNNRRKKEIDTTETKINPRLKQSNKKRQDQVQSSFFLLRTYSLPRKSHAQSLSRRLPINTRKEESVTSVNRPERENINVQGEQRPSTSSRSKTWNQFCRGTTRNQWIESRRAQP